MTEVLTLLTSAAVPGSAIGAAIIGIVAMMRLRSTDREALSSSQRSYIDLLNADNKAADERADKYKAEVDHERLMRMDAERARLIAEGQVQALQDRVTALESRLQQSHPNVITGE